MDNQMDIRKIGSFIQAMRKEHGITQKELGEKVGVTDKAVSKWERGLSFPDITLLPTIALALGVSVDEIINGQRNRADAVDAAAVSEVVGKTMEYTKRSYTKQSKKVAVTIMACAALFAAVVCLIVNVAVQRTVSWALYPIGGLALLLLPVFTALFSSKHKLEYAVLVLFALLCGYFLLVQYLSNSGNWALTLGLPLAALGCLCLYGVGKAFAHFKINRFYAWAVSLLVVGLGPLLLTNPIVRMNGINSDDYTAMIGVPVCVVAAVILFLIGRLKNK